MNLDTPQDPKGPATQQEVLHFLGNAKKWEGKEAIDKDKKSIGDVAYYQGGRTMKGGAYDTTFGNHNYTCCQFRVGLAPDKCDDAVGFRVVIGGKQRLTR